jgi:hypothetical protein
VGADRAVFRKAKYDMIRTPLFQLITQKYEVFEDPKSEAPVGKASVTEGLIESLLIRSDAPEIYKGQILNRLLRAILEDADRFNSNLSIKVADDESVRLKRFLERYGFKENPPSVFKRPTGSSIPPSVIW